MSDDVPELDKASVERLMALPLDEGDVLILTHDNPDPDCLASAAALKHLLYETRRVNATIAYSGIIGRAENRTMVHLLDLPAHNIIEFDFSDFRYIALIDAQPRTGNTAVPDDREVDIVIDHHPMRDTTRCVPFYDVRPGIGAAATVLTGLLRAAEVEIPSDLATALLYGIRSETQDLGREVSDHDRKAYEFLFPLVDTIRLSAISRPTLERRYYEQLALALGVLRAGRRSAWCVLSDVNDPDFVPEIADFAVRMEGIDWALAIGAHAGRLYVSIRSNLDDAHAEVLMHTMLDGLGRGGGHGMRAGGALPIPATSHEREVIEREIVRRFLEGTGEDDPSIEFAGLAQRFGAVDPSLPDQEPNPRVGN